MFGIFKRKAKETPTPQRERGHFMRMFAAAEVSRILKPWVWDGGFSNGEIATALAVIRARSRDMAKNSEHFVRWLDLFVANVIGDGMKFKSMPGRDNAPEAIDAAAAKFLQYHWWRWSTAPELSDVSGRKSFAAICRLCAENWARDGEAFVLIDRAAQNDYGFSLRVVRPDAIDETMNGAKGTTAIRNGVEIDRATLRPVAYYFRADREDPAASWVLNRPVVRKPAADVLHLYTQHDETQTRGIPLGHAVLKKLKMLDEYNVAELVAARDEANTTGIFSAPFGRDGEPGEYTDEESAALTMPSEPGTKMKLEPGWDYKTVTPTHPNRELTAFKNSMLRDVASGLGLEYSCFANDYAGVSYSSVRAGTIAERDHWRILQAQFIDQIASPVYRAWLASFLKYRASSPYVAADFARLVDHEFRGRTWEWVDPAKDVNAAATAVAHGWKTDSQIAADYGTDFEENLIEMKRLKKKKESAGLLTAPAKVEKNTPKTGKEADEETSDD
ncbi:MAG: phage portal protein [Kiritimatiellae bacterium]|nr:phage portal protein [Kiritimatiellia bacterium]